MGGGYGDRVPDPSFDPIAEAHRQWRKRWPARAERMAAVTSIMRAQQVVLAEVERVLKPYELTFASYEALQLLAFTREGRLPMGKIGERLMVHPASVTNTVERLERRGLVRRRPADEDRRRVLAEITPEGRDVAGRATTALNRADFGLGGVDESVAIEVNSVLRKIRVAGADIDETAQNPWTP